MPADVSILLSTYNGSAYVAQQIQSIQQQTYENWQLLVRDDGSKDNTVSIVEDFSKKDPRIQLLPQSENLGVIDSFFTLLKKAASPYYMFCDQDDFWLPEKVEKTLKKMQEVEKGFSGPILVHTDLQVVDENLNPVSPSFIELQKMSPEKDQLKDLMIQNNITGCTVMINEALKQQLKYPQKVLMHDHWLGLVASAFGKVVFLPESTILYRQHGNNTVGATKAGLKNLMEKFKKQEASLAVLKKGIAQSSEFYLLYQKELSKEQQELLSMYAQSQNVSKKERRQVMKRYQLRKNTWWRNLGFYYLYLWKL